MNTPDAISDLAIKSALCGRSDASKLEAELDTFLASPRSASPVEIVRRCADLGYRLGLDDLEKWGRAEEEGYRDHLIREIPEYRKPSGSWVVSGRLTRNPTIPPELYLGTLTEGVESLQAHLGNGSVQVLIPELTDFVQSKFGIVVSAVSIDERSIRDSITAIKNQGLSILRRIRRTLGSPIHGGGDSLAAALPELEPELLARSSGLFQSRHFSSAVLEAAKYLIEHTKERSGRKDLDGVSLMRTVFSPRSPILKVNSLSNQAEIDEQEGVMHLLAGAVLALRNPRAHAHWTDSRDGALSALHLLSYLLRRVDDSHA